MDLYLFYEAALRYTALYIKRFQQSLVRLTLTNNFILEGKNNCTSSDKFHLDDLQYIR